MPNQVLNKQKRLLELFSGTHSIGHAASKRGWEITSVDWDLPAQSSQYDYISKNHIMTDIMKWDYKSLYKPGDFDLITLSPTCLWWSQLRLSNIGKTFRTGRWKGQVFTREMADLDIEDFGIPMVDKCLEILDYLKPKYYWIENPKSGGMKTVLDPLLPHIDLDYCKFGFEYRKSTRFWTNIDKKAVGCDYDCDYSYLYEKTGKMRHIGSCDGGTMGYSSTTRLTRYRIPEGLVNYLLDGCL